MSEQDIQRLTRVLEEIRDLQREQLAAVRAQAERTERIQTRAEQLQDRQAQMVGGARRTVAVLLPVIVALIGYLSWLMFR